MPKCILCDGNAVISRQENASRTIYNCPYCGVFVISDPVEKEVKANRYKLASFLVNRHLSGSNDIILISLENTTKDKGYVHMSVDQIVREFPQSVVMRTKLALKNLVNESEYPGAELRIENLSQGPIFYLEKVNFEAMSFSISTLEHKGLITVNYQGSSFFPCTIVVTAEGWDLAAAMETDAAYQDAALIALSGTSEYAKGYVKTAASVCRSSGYRLLEYPCYNEETKIGHRLFAEVRASRFVVCDVSDASPEVYFVAGMAKALGKTLILTCRAKDRKKLRLETEHTTVLFWEDMVDLDDELSNAIRAMVF
jgi:hypothetical protein